jgi:deoxyribodipyrimidine photo-lyase
MAMQARGMPVAIVWFRDDLRLDDNPALKAAIEGGYTPVPVYVHAPDEEGAWAPGAASDAWRHRSLAALDDALHARGSRLRRFFGPSLATLRSLVAMSGAEAVFWNRRYEPAIERRDADIKRALRADGVRAESFNGALLFEPWELATKQGDPYKVFTPFWKTALATWRAPKLWDAPARLAPLDDIPEGVELAALKLAPAVDWDAGIRAAWQPGVAGARVALQGFIGGVLAGYRETRELPAQAGTSRLSPHLHFGELSVQRVAACLHDARGGAPGEEVDGYLRQLGWREFSFHLLHHFPRVAEHSLNPRFDDFDWADPDPVAIAAWQRGRTGVPIIDAGMRQLWHSGWMHNRVRMLVASFLTKNLRQHWLHGARWFWDTLVDADLANNTQGWQWTAGTGADAAPYFRIFNPVSQAQRFDPTGAYVRRWLPELVPLPDAALFAPWEHPDLLEAVAPGYPRRPIVDLAATRATALDAYRRARR